MMERTASIHTKFAEAKWDLIAAPSNKCYLNLPKAACFKGKSRIFHHCDK